MGAGKAIGQKINNDCTNKLKSSQKEIAISQVNIAECLS